MAGGKWRRNLEQNNKYLISSNQQPLKINYSEWTKNREIPDGAFHLFKRMFHLFFRFQVKDWLCLDTLNNSFFPQQQLNDSFYSNDRVINIHIGFALLCSQHKCTLNPLCWRGCATNPSRVGNFYSFCRLSNGVKSIFFTDIATFIIGFFKCQLAPFEFVDWGKFNELPTHGVRATSHK